jgi:hypothetical protein
MLAAAGGMPKGVAISIVRHVIWATGWVSHSEIARLSLSAGLLPAHQAFSNCVGNILLSSTWEGRRRDGLLFKLDRHGCG